jgi:hypothetical protein
MPLIGDSGRGVGHMGCASDFLVGVRRRRVPHSFYGIYKRFFIPQGNRAYQITAQDLNTTQCVSYFGFFYYGLFQLKIRASDNYGFGMLSLGIIQNGPSVDPWIRCKTLNTPQ